MSRPPSPTGWARLPFGVYQWHHTDSACGENYNMERFNRITSDPTRLNGEPCIRNLRLTVRRVLEALAINPDRTDLRREYPELEDEDIRHALDFAAHRSMIM